MPSPTERTRNNVRMGIFVSFALLLAMVIVFALSDIWSKITHRTDEWTVRFPISSGVTHIKTGSEVRVGGLALGSVRRVEPIYPTTSGEKFEFVRVHFELDENVRLFSDATILASSQLIGAEGWIDILRVGTPEAGHPVGDIDGTESLGMLASILGPDVAARTRDFIATLPDEYQQRIVPIFDDVKDTTGRVRTTVADFTTDTWPEWRERLDATFVSVESATAKADELMDDGRRVAAQVSEVITENRPHVLATMENVDYLTGEWIDVTHQLREEIVPKVSNLLDTGQDGLDRAVAAIQRLREDYEGWSVTLGETLAAANLTGQQLKLASIELRRAPWKLLHRPSQRELEHELLYEAARTFALAASQLKAASESVQRVMDTYGDDILDDPAARERVQRSILDPVENYTKAQERLLDILFTKYPQ
jgi:hypothetical protein